MNNYLKKIFLYTLLTLINIVPVFANKSALINDVDSIGDLWIFALDKTGSMLFERVDPYRRVRINPQDIADDVIKRLNREDGILDCIDYTQDKIAIYETGYGFSKEDSYGHRFDCAESLDKSFIHIVQTPQPFKTNGKKGLMRVLRDKLERDNYVYQESFVSQIRVLILSRIVDYIKENDLGNSFRNIHLVIVTDDADENDQWKTDYYAIKFRSKKKFEELNALHSKYIYSSFTQLGGGYLEERSDMTDISAAKHIYLYDYVTLQQKDKKVEGVDFVKIVPLDGSCINVKVILNEYESDEIDFVYIEQLKINDQELHIGRYITDTSSIAINYNNGLCKNKVEIKGQVQLQYVDSIYGVHARKIDFETHCVVLPQGIRIFINVLYIILATFIILTIIFFVWILPNIRVMTIYVDNAILQIRRGYKWQWKETINPLLYTIYNGKKKQLKTVFAKHPCYNYLSAAHCIENNTIWVIDSHRPLRYSTQLNRADSMMDIKKYIQRNDATPSIIKSLYESWWISRMDILVNSRHKWVRGIGRNIRTVYNMTSPHYLYWGTMQDVEKSTIVNSPILPKVPFFLELKTLKTNYTTNIDYLLSAYYMSHSTSHADVLITIQKENTNLVWNIFQLQSKLHLGYGISAAQRLMHYEHPLINKLAYQNLIIRLKNTIKKELKTSSIYVLDYSTSIVPSCEISFNVEDNIWMSYMYLVDDTIEGCAQMIYSPLSDTLSPSNPRKMVTISQSKYDKELFTSLLPFDSEQDRPKDGVCRRESTIKFLAGGALYGELHIDKNIVRFLNVTIKMR